MATFVDDEGTVTNSNSGFDQVNGGAVSGNPAGHVLHARLLHYFGKDVTGSSDRGQSNLDLVDVLDAMTCGGMTEAEADQLLLDVHKYNYDFIPASGLCD